jgi:hypothetical protein
VLIADVHAINTGLYSVLIAKFTGAGMIAASSRLVSGRISSSRAFVPEVLVFEQLTCAPRIPLIFLVKREQALLLVDFAVLEVAVTTD